MLPDSGGTDEEENPDDITSLFLFEPEEWRKRAECAKLDMPVKQRVALFFPQRGNHTHALAKATCAACPVKQECADYQRRTNSVGIWAGRVTQRSSNGASHPIRVEH